MKRGRKGLSVVLVCVALFACGCAASATSRLSEKGFAAPGDALAAFRRNWNAQNDAGLVATFVPVRRSVIRGVGDRTKRRMAAWRVTDAVLQQQCNPRGVYFETAVLELRPRVPTTASKAVDHEVVWLRLQDGVWWMYSL